MLFVRYLSFENLTSATRLYFSSIAKLPQTDRHAKMLAEMSIRPHGDYKNDDRRLSSVQGTRCNAYLVTSGTLTKNTIWAAKQLSELQEKRGARIFLTWPAVAGQNCYDRRPPLADSVKSLFGRFGMNVIGEPEDSEFTPEHMLDTYYHIDSSAAKVRTARLISRLSDAGLGASPPSDRPSTVWLAFGAMRKMETSLNWRQSLLPLAAGSYLPNTPNFKRHFLLLNGWYAPEPWGIWSEGDQSEIRFVAAAYRCSITLHTRYLRPAGEDKSRFIINNGPMEAETGSPIDILGSGQPVTLRLFHRNVASPKSVGLGPDTRYLKYGLLKIDVACPGTPSKH